MGFTKNAPCPHCIFALPESAAPTGVFRRIPENREINRSNLWRLVSCSVRRQQVAVGSADRQEAEPGTARSKGLRPSRALPNFLTVWFRRVMRRAFFRLRFSSDSARKLGKIPIIKAFDGSNEQGRILFADAPFSHTYFCIFPCPFERAGSFFHIYSTSSPSRYRSLFAISSPESRHR